MRKSALTIAIAIATIHVWGQTNTLPSTENEGTGTTAPSNVLDINGDINFTGNLYQYGQLLNLSGNDPIWQKTREATISYNAFGTIFPVQDFHVAGGNIKIGGEGEDYALILESNGLLDATTMKLKSLNNIGLAITDQNNNTKMVVKTNGYIGIGTISPSKKLDVNGDINLTGDFYKNGQLINLIEESGSSLWQTTGSKIYYNIGNIGIGTSTPTYGLHINKSGAKFLIEDGGIRVVNVVNNNVYLGDLDNDDLGTRFLVQSNLGNFQFLNGDVGIGTTTPSKKLDVNGDINLTGDLYKNGELLSLNGGTTLWETSGSNIYYEVGNVGIGVRNPTHRLDINGTFHLGVGEGTEDFAVYSNADGVYAIRYKGETLDLLLNEEIGNVGIGNNSPVALLTIGPGFHEKAALSVKGLSGCSTIANFKDLNGDNIFQLSGSLRGDDLILNFGDIDLSNFGTNFIIDEANRKYTFNQGNVGIGNLNPTKKLDVAGDINFTGNLYKNGSLVNLSGLWNKTGNDLYYQSGNVGIGTTTPQGNLDITSSTSPTLKLRTTGDGTNYISRIELTGAAQNGNIGEINFINGSRDCDNTPDAAIRAYSHSAPDNADLVFYTAREGVFAQRMIIKDRGEVGIGVNEIPNGYKLAVDGKAYFEEITVEMSENWSDFVFESDYNLMTLKDLETFIKSNKHLPEIPTTSEVEQNGISVGEMNTKLLQKIEELTLYTLQQQELIEGLLQRVEQLENK